MDNPKGLEKKSILAALGGQNPKQKNTSTKLEPIWYYTVCFGNMNQVGMEGSKGRHKELMEQNTQVRAPYCKELGTAPGS